LRIRNFVATDPTQEVFSTLLVKVGKGCDLTLFDDFSVDLTTSELGVASSTTLAPVQDSESRLNSGDGLTLCGPRVYTLLSPATAWPATVTLT